MDCFAFSTERGVSIVILLRTIVRSIVGTIVETIVGTSRGIAIVVVPTLEQVTNGTGVLTIVALGFTLVANLISETVASVAVGNTVVDAAKVNEAVGVVGVGSGGRGVREGDVVTTEVVTAVAGVLVELRHFVLAILVLGLVDGLVVLGQSEWLVTGSFEDDLLSVVLAGAVGAHAEETLDLVVDKGPHRLRHGLSPATMIVVSEEHLLLRL